MSGLSDMSSLNTGFRVDVSTNDQEQVSSMEICLGPEKGSYMINIDDKQQILQVFSPVSSNVYNYKYDVNNQRWIDQSDGHIFLELLVRELMKVLNGMPSL